MHEIDWRHYWLDVQIPGLDLWSLPLLRGEKVPEDPALGLTPAIAAVKASENHLPASLRAAGTVAEDARGDDAE